MLERRGIGLETSILFAKEGASVLMSDISQPALAKAIAKVQQLVPMAPRLEIMVKPTPLFSAYSMKEDQS
jgi:NAD(P)-dependent dehydrogenase (short-subunit alcohol dehydrogenase family)